MRKTKKSPLLPRFLAGCAYFFCMLQWLWIVILVLPILIDSGVLAAFAPPRIEEPAQPQNDGPTSPVLLAIGGVVTIVMVVITIIILVLFPSKVAKTGQTVVHKTTEVILPVVTHHKPVSAKKRHWLTSRVLFYVKLAVVILPLLACFVLPESETIKQDLILFIGACLGMVSLGLFVLEYLLIYMMSRKKLR